MAAVTIRYWAGAARAAGTSAETAQLATLRELRADLAQRPALAALSAVAALLVDGVRHDEDAPLPAGATVDVLPPFAGGAEFARRAMS